MQQKSASGAVCAGAAASCCGRLTTSGGAKPPGEKAMMWLATEPRGSRLMATVAPSEKPASATRWRFMLYFCITMGSADRRYVASGPNCPLRVSRLRSTARHSATHMSQGTCGSSDLDWDSGSGGLCGTLPPLLTRSLPHPRLAPCSVAAARWCASCPAGAALSRAAPVHPLRPCPPGETSPTSGWACPWSMWVERIGSHPCTQGLGVLLNCAFGPAPSPTHAAAIAPLVLLHLLLWPPMLLQMLLLPPPLPHTPAPHLS